MKLILFLAFVVIYSPSVVAQNPSVSSQVKAQQIILKKQILIDELDAQAKNVSLAAVRIYARIKLAEWLWKDGKDATQRAETLALLAAEELYEKKNEIPSWFYLRAELFSLLETKAKEIAKKLTVKYNIGEEEDLSNASALLSKQGGDKILAAKIKKALVSEKDLSTFNLMLVGLREIKSPEYLSLLYEIVTLEETGRSNFSSDSLSWVVEFYRDAIVPNELKTRFYRIVLAKVRSAVQSFNASDITFADQLLYSILPDISTNAPDFLPEATALKAVLWARTSQKMKDSQERAKRLAESQDKLATLISEAEEAETKGIKTGLYGEAAEEALKREKFRLAVDLYGKAFENIDFVEPIKPERRYAMLDSQLNEVVKAALGKNDVESAEYATKRVKIELSKAEALRQIAIYFHENKDSAAALDAYYKSLNLVAKTDSTGGKLYMLFRLIRVAQKIDTNSLAEVLALTAKTINSLPTLNPEDKPGTPNFDSYVGTIMVVNGNVNLVMRDLVKKNKSEATDFASRINQKEVRLVADAVLAMEATDSDLKQIKGKNLSGANKK